MCVFTFLVSCTPEPLEHPVARQPVSQSCHYSLRGACAILFNLHISHLWSRCSPTTIRIDSEVSAYEGREKKNADGNLDGQLFPLRRSGTAWGDGHVRYSLQASDQLVRRSSASFCCLGCTTAPALRVWQTRCFEGRVAAFISGTGPTNRCVHGSFGSHALNDN